ncbi:unnamed protein product [Darwinula stevensoni]|uniref:Uncharacterized protein n=1 Tax=Darwinula stevensoni TaxID=69355 RepID=A0A7R9A3L4_9CRUS|nr:unnamed protein product [Darwinula stevensoni]CAG0888209.1 unnamed protein product [Darwinula stevensoni]
MEFKALRKPSALFKYVEILFGFLALVLYRGAKLPLWEVSNSTILWMNPNLDEGGYVVLGCLLGLFLSTVVFFALALGHEPGLMEMVHGGASGGFYLVTGLLLLDSASDSHESKEAPLILTSAVFCILLTFVFMANALFAAWKWRNNTG